MAAIGLLHGVHRKGADCVDAKLLEFLVGFLRGDLFCVISDFGLGAHGCLFVGLGITDPVIDEEFDGLEPGNPAENAVAAV